VIPHFLRLDFAFATRSALLAMAGVMDAAAVVALIGLRAKVQSEPDRNSDDSGAVVPALAPNVRPGLRRSRLS
jgi:hypothetical protein